MFFFPVFFFTIASGLFLAPCFDAPDAFGEVSFFYFLASCHSALFFPPFEVAKLIWSSLPFLFVSIGSMNHPFSCDWQGSGSLDIGRSNERFLPSFFLD